MKLPPRYNPDPDDTNDAYSLARGYFFVFLWVLANVVIFLAVTWALSLMADFCKMAFKP